jgi:subtilisin family serine protease
LLRGTLLPSATGLATVLTVMGVLGSAPGIAAVPVRAQEWWLASLQVTQAWEQAQGTGITVAVLGTGVDASYPGLAGSVITGPDYSGAAGSGRQPGGPYWGVEGTAVASLIAGHGSGPGITGVAPAAKILSVRVTLEFNDPLASDQAVSRRLPAAVAEGIRYAADHGARIIDLPLDPGTLGLTSSGDPAAAGGSPAERAAVAYALSKGAVLVAPAGDDGQGPGLVNYPAAYPGVIAVGAIDRAGHLAAFSSTRSRASLTAPGVSLPAAIPPDGYRTISSTSTASGIVAGVAALVMSRFPHLTAAQVTRALIGSTGTAPRADLTSLPPLPARSAGGAGYGTVDAIRALAEAVAITAASQPHQPAQTSQPVKPASSPAAAPHPRTAASALAGSVLRDAVIAAGVLIALLLAALLVGRLRRERGRAAAARARIQGQHEHRRPAAPVSPPAGGEIARLPDATSRPVMAARPGTARGYRTGRSAAGRDGAAGPPWEAAPEPEREIGPLPVVPGPLPLEPGRIRLPGDMPAPEAAGPSSSWDLAASDGPPDDGPDDGSGGLWHRGRL